MFLALWPLNNRLVEQHFSGIEDRFPLGDMSTLPQDATLSCMMSFSGLSWRIGLPYGALVLAGSILLMVVMAAQLRREDEERFERLARTNADFIARMQLPASARMAANLTSVTGVEVLFRQQNKLLPEESTKVPATEVLALPSDGSCRRLGEHEVAILPLEGNPGTDLVMIRPAERLWTTFLQPRSFLVLSAFWLFAILLGWGVSRSMVRPLRHLAERMPDIEKPGPLDLPEMTRKDEIGDLARSFARTRDELHQEQAKRAQAEKFAALGRMTAAMAHEIQNPVSAIKLHAQLAASDGPNELAEIVIGEASRIESLVNQWLFLTKPAPPAKSLIALGEVIASTIRTYEAQLRHAGATAVVKQDKDISILADARRLSQVFSNLLLNAIQAMPEGGTCTISCRQEKDSARITFTDQGFGFSTAALQRFTEFFYTEKEGGMGIGLAVASEIVKAHGGTIEARNEPARGASVTLTFPITGA